jgi:hypothetical protein
MVLALDLLRCSGNGNQVGEAFPDWFGSWSVVVYPVSNYDAETGLWVCQPVVNSLCLGLFCTRLF